jgi:phage FluMu protein Com
LAQPKPKAASLLEERCLCGSLVAKISPDGVEILCRRCKRIHVIPWPEERRAGSAAQKGKVPVNR